MSDLTRANLKAALLAGIAMAGTAMLASAAVPAAAGDLRLALPVACEIGRDCFVQNFFDHDPGPERRDYACGNLSYDGHTGTDFRVADIPAMTRGVTVVAAAGGTVKAVRDGMPDAGLAGTSREALKGREAGNGVVIDHGDGWETQYSHLLKGSTLVRPGQTVEAGTPLGRIGMSGQAEFPHVELAVRHEGKAVDPFTGSAGPAGCGETGGTLWQVETMAVLKYQPTGGLVSGFAAGPAVSEDARKGAYAQQTLKDPPALVFWADVFGVQGGDEQRMSIAAPGGQVIHETASTLKSGKVSWFAFSGRKRPAEGWQAGTYRGTYTLLRNGAVAARLEDSVELQ
jgi:hypothetical protein